jgi:hypothetical protein
MLNEFRRLSGQDNINENTLNEDTTSELLIEDISLMVRTKTICKKLGIITVEDFKSFPWFSKTIGVDRLNSLTNKRVFDMFEDMHRVLSEDYNIRFSFNEGQDNINENTLNEDTYTDVANVVATKLVHDLSYNGTSDELYDFIIKNEDMIKDMGSKISDIVSKYPEIMILLAQNPKELQKLIDS